MPRRLPSFSVRLTATSVAILFAMALPTRAADDAETEFFEKRIRPVLVERCYECHNSGAKTDGGLTVDHREGLLAGGDSGAAVVPGKPQESLLLAAIRHATAELRMPQGGPKLSDAVIADFTRWIERGAVDPRDRPPTPDELSATTSWEAIRQRRKEWWSFQPIAKPELPAENNWSEHPIDRFVFAKLAEQGLRPADAAERRTLVRRATLALTGMPPTVEETEAFSSDESPQDYERLIDRLLASPRFGERWARHWMDWFRYAESHGSEGDPAIPYAWRYRDYLIRALNDDVAYDQLVREHLAGDLLPEPRINRELAINESALGTAQLRMVQHGYAPTDALDEQITFTDNQIDVVSKAFLGLTVSCARCHNHKFDPIGQSDFYALYGILASCRPALVTVDLPERRNAHREELTRLKGQIKQQLAATWLRSLDELPGKLQTLPAEWQPAIDAAAKDRASPLHAWATLRNKQGAEFAEGWKQLENDWNENANERGAQQNAAYPLRWNLTGADYERWFKHGNALADRPSASGEFHVLPSGDQAAANVYRAGVFSHLLSSKHNGVLTSPRFKIETDWLSLRVAGGEGARVRLVVRNYPRVPGLLYEAYQPASESFEWRHWDVRYWKGEWAHIEIATAGDLPVEAKTDDSRSWFGIAEVIGRNNEPPPREFGAPLAPVVGSPSPASAEELAKGYAAALRQCIEHWAAGSISDDEAEFLGFWVRGRLLPNTLDALPQAAPLIAEYRRLEAEIPWPTRSPGVLEGTVFDQPLFVRGDHKQPGQPVARRFLEVFNEPDAAIYPKDQSGRLQLARDIASPRNPLAARVIVNRIWHHLFGRGIVATTDNFGRLGEEPADGKLLDYLAARFVEEGWSIKRMVRLMATSETFRQSSRHADHTSAAKSLFSPFAVRRLEAEAIRDSMLFVSGQFDAAMFGPSVDGKSRRASVYVRTQRNNLDPLLSVFDAPEPNTTRGVRDATNVPAQSLVLLNDPWIAEQARRWAERIAGDATLADDDARIGRMYAESLGRPPRADELRRSREFLDAQERRRADTLNQVLGLERQVRERQAELAALLSPVRQKLLAERAPAAAPIKLPQPMARWEFEKDLNDSLGDLHATAVGAARVENGALLLDGASYAQSPPLARGLKEKTLEAWIELDDLEQRGGGVMSVETLQGEVFDAIVFGEQQPREWLAGSDFFRRTQPFAGPEEQATGAAAVHLAIVYQADGRIAAYRDGKAYGKAYASAGPIAFEPGASHVVFGLRHSPAGGNKLLKGRILQAQLYDRALGAEEIAASAASLAGSISDEQVIAALSEAAKAQYDRLQDEIAQLNARLKPYEPRDAWRPDPLRRWQELAQALFSLKEFIYVR